MTNEEQKLREIAEKWGWFVKAISIDMTRFELNKDTEQCFSDLTALISEHYTANEEVEKMVEEKLRELSNDPKFLFDICLSFRHDFGLLSAELQEGINFQAKEWLRAIQNNLKTRER